MQAALFLVAALCFVGGDHVPINNRLSDAKNEPQGTWSVVSVKSDRWTSDRQAVTVEVNVSSHKLSLHYPDGVYEGSFSVDTSRNPKRIDFSSSGFKYTCGKRPGYLLDSWIDVKGIYCLKDDMLLICFTHNCDANIFPIVRPDGFSVQPGSERTLLVLKRKSR